jgi:hypothetical protein
MYRLAASIHTESSEHKHDCFAEIFREKTKRDSLSVGRDVPICVRQCSHN